MSMLLCKVENMFSVRKLPDPQSLNSALMTFSFFRGVASRSDEVARAEVRQPVLPLLLVAVERRLMPTTAVKIADVDCSKDLNSS